MIFNKRRENNCKFSTKLEVKWINYKNISNEKLLKALDFFKSIFRMTVLSLNLQFKLGLNLFGNWVL